MTRQPDPPPGWHLIAPSDAVPGDGALLPDGTVRILDGALFDPIPVEVRRVSWAISQAAPSCSKSGSNSTGH